MIGERDAAGSGITREDIVADLRRLGIAAGEALIVHSSLRSIGWVEGGAEAVIEALQEGLTPEGTLAMPTFTAPAAEFIVAETPSSTGLATETFRRLPGVLRSAHPTHSVAVWGRHAAEVAAGHDRATALGVDSPLHRMAQRGAWVLMIGVDCRRCSLIHIAEALERAPYLSVPYPGYDGPTTIRNTDGSSRVYREREVPGDSSHFLVVQEECERRGKVIRGAIGAADSVLVKGQDLLRAAADLLKANPAALLCDRPDCPVCVESRRVTLAARLAGAQSRGID